MKAIFWIFLLIIFLSCNKTVEVSNDEIGIVFSNWNGKTDSIFYEQGSYKIPSYKGFVASKIIENTESVIFDRRFQNKNMKSNIVLRVKPIPLQNFELYDSLGIDYSQKIVRPILITELKGFENFQGTNKELLQELKSNLLMHEEIQKYLTITRLEIK